MAEKEEEKEASCEWEKCVSMEDKKFVAEEVASDLLADTNNERVDKYLTGISYAMLG